MQLKPYKSLESLCFDGKGENYVREKFITPLLGFLGYDNHKDYEVIRDGDDGASFKLQYPPVRSGAKPEKSYNPDYIPTIRKQCFWVIEAKKAKDLAYPFGKEYITQGLQYAIHPEIRANYLVLSNGKHTCIYDAYFRIYEAPDDLYKPVLEFMNTEISTKWGEIHALLSTEKLRSVVERDVIGIYEKLAISSFNKSYPLELLEKISIISENASKEIASNVVKIGVDMYVKDVQNDFKASTEMELYEALCFPMSGGKGQGHHYVQKCLKGGIDERSIFEKLRAEYPTANVFKKENIIVALCTLELLTSDVNLQTEIQTARDHFLQVGILALNEVECLFLRNSQKYYIIKKYEELKLEIAESFATMPEYEKYINTPSAFGITYGEILCKHMYFFEYILTLDEATLRELFEKFVAIENDIDKHHSDVIFNLPTEDTPVYCDFRYIGLNFNDSISNIALNYKLHGHEYLSM